ncbi:hypothetical protein LguiA_017668 [Lonicera macranthoides]
MENGMRELRKKYRITVVKISNGRIGMPRLLPEITDVNSLKDVIEPRNCISNTRNKAQLASNIRTFYTGSALKGGTKCDRPGYS